MSNPIRVLHITGAMYPGGMENFIMNLYQNIDRTQLQFDFVVHARKEQDYQELIEHLGGQFFVVPRLTKHPFKSLAQLYRIIKNNHYQVVVRHTSNALIAPQLLIAKLAGAKTICHSHNVTDPQRKLHRLGQWLLPLCTDANIACSNAAGLWMFGKRPFLVINNAIDTHKYAYCADKAEKINHDFALEGLHMYGNIANFIASKNHLFLLKIFQEIAKLDNKARFFCLGEGDLRQKIEENIKSSGLEDKVILTGIRHDVDFFMSRMDVLIFPSLFEGLPLTLIEAQAAGLPILMSDTITPEVIVTKGLVESLSLEKDAKEWAKKAVEMCYQQKKPRVFQQEEIAQHGYDITQLTTWYQQYLLDFARKQEHAK